MKKLLISTGCFLFACVIVFFIASFMSDQNTENIAVNPDTEFIENSSYYIVKEYKGNVAVFESGKETPFRITEVHLAELPSADRKLLEKGIKASNQEELNCILEDYCS